MGIPFSQVPTWDDRTPIYVISVAAQLAGMHPQTLRQYDRLGLVMPSRASGRGRRYSAYDVAKLRYVQHLSQEEGVNLAGIRHILELQSEVEDLRSGSTSSWPKSSAVSASLAAVPPPAGSSRPDRPAT